MTAPPPPHGSDPAPSVEGAAPGGPPPVTDAQVPPGFTPPGPPPAVPSPLPMADTQYHHFLRTPRQRWWKALLLVIGVLAAYAVLSLLSTGAAMVVDLVNGRNEGILEGRLEVTPALFLGTNIGLALMIPACMLLQWAIYGQRPRWMSSVEGRFRWGLLARCALVLVPIYLIYIGGSMAITGWPTGPINPEALPFVVITLLTTPLQSAGEEYAVRGALTRAIASWIPPRLVAFLVASVVSGMLFALGHPNLTPARMAIYILVALGFSVLVWRTGGLEAAVLGHALNNLFVIIPTALWGDMTAALLGVEAESGVIDVVIIVALAAVSWGAVELVFRRSKYSRVSAGQAPV